MKYGRTYETLLAEHEDWRKHAIHYKEMKKVINRVVEELDSLGLTSGVLSDLLQEPPSAMPPGNRSRPRSITIGRGKRRARASYELEGSPEHPEPRIRIVFSSATSSSGTEATSEDNTTPLYRQRSDASTSSAFLEELDESTSADEHQPPLQFPAAHGSSPVHNLLLRLYGQGVAPAADASPPGSPETLKGSPEHTSMFAKQSVKPEAEDPVDAMLAASLMLPPVMDMRNEAFAAQDRAIDADDEMPNGKTSMLNGEHLKPHPRRRHKRRHRKEILISLDQDTQFFALLGNALQSLEELEMKQKAAFTDDVSALANKVGKVSAPSRPKNDLYGWRDVFTLWVEADIFQGHTELDRKEHSVEDTEKRLQWFVDQVGRRGLAKRMRNKESAAALEDFVRLNAQLLELKRFQEANETAARKILKKHDKRTALTAVSGFPSFVKQTHHLNDEPRTLILPGYPSLPRLLLIQLTTTLLPIVPQVDDYACIICGDIAYKPIRLDCSHRFCVRCLVKMQKRGQNACPSCRAPVVLTANAANLDAALQAWLKIYFPREVKAKAKENEKESAKEQLEEMGFKDHRCLIM